MDFSSANATLWAPIIQLGIIAMLILVANVLRRKIAFIRNSLMPTAVLAGFLMLLLRNLGFKVIDGVFLESVTYHAIALGFIALSLRVPEDAEGESKFLAPKNGALIVSTYLVQALTGLAIALILAYTVMPDLFKASGILLPMAYGQGPGQANNVGTTYEALGMVGGRSFGLSLAAAGYLCACLVGVVYMNILSRKDALTRTKEKDYLSGSVTVDTFQADDEIPVAESVDKCSVQAALVAIIYLLTYLAIDGVVSLLENFAPGLAATVSTLLWGFNFIVGSVIATGCRVLFVNLRRVKLMHRQYQNNYLLSRISGVAFDFMIVAGIASIEVNDLSGYWLPFLLMAVMGGIVTFAYLMWMCKKLYPNYVYEGFFSMFGMLTGTISSGVLLLREIDPELKTPASNNLVTGSSFGIVFGFPMLLIVSFAPKSTTTIWLSIAFVIAYLTVLILFMLKVGNRKK